MNRGRGTASIVASPVLVGAVTTLIVVVSVFLAYNANKGLPFVPTYDLSAKLPGAANLVPGNEVRIGGFRVGVVDQIRPGITSEGGVRRSIAIVDMKLDKTIQPLSRDTRVIVRARSALGLKYVQLTPGTSSVTLTAGSTVPLANATQPVEFDDLLNTFDLPTRTNSQQALTGFGDALAGRGTSLNLAIAAFNPFFQYLQPVMANLGDPRTQLNQFFKNIGNVTGQVAPVARTQAVLFTHMADTFRAINSTEGQCAGGSCLGQTIEKSPPGEDTAISSFRVQRPFLVDFTDLSRRLIPGVRVLPVALPKLNSALVVGTPVVRASAELNVNTKNLFVALDDLAKDPNTLLALQDLRDLTGVGAPLLQYVAPFQTVCNYADYFFYGLGLGHLSEETSGGVSERVLVKNDNGNQQNRVSDFGFRPVDIPANISAHTAKDPISGKPLEALHGVAFPPAIDAQGNANCQSGQLGYPQGPITPAGAKGRYPPANVANPSNPSITDLQNFDKTAAGGSHVVTGAYPRDTGTTFTGVPSLRAVP